MLFTIYGEYVRHVGGEIWVGSLTKLLGEFGLSEPAVRAAISRMQKQGWLISRKVGNRSYYSMSERGQKRLDEAAMRIYPSERMERWSGNWCIVSYHIPETQRNLRDQLRKELGFLGFGMLTNSTWISPNDLQEQVTELAQNYELQDHMEIFQATHVGFREPRALVEKCWNLGEIQSAYEVFIEKYELQYQRDQAIAQKDGLSDNDCFVQKTKLVHDYRKFLFIDPDLPDELLPSPWLGKEADQLFSHYYQLLHPGAVRFFEEVYQPVPKK